ncbi:MAG: ABC transporter ATP-binding protein [Actinomycetota bacterium]
MTDEPSAALEYRQVVKAFGSGSNEVWALSGVSLAVEPGEFVAVMGPSGCGKSTLLHLAGGLEHPSAGRVLVHGRDLADATVAELARLRRQELGYVFQELNLVPALTAVENVMLPLELDGVGMRSARAQAVAALERVGLPGRGDAFPDDLSGGQRQRVAIARAIVGGRAMVLADEPTGALDTATSDRIVSLLAELATVDGTTVVMVTHEPRLASWADRIVFLRDGLVVDESTPSSDTPTRVLS